MELFLHVDLGCHVWTFLDHIACSHISCILEHYQSLCKSSSVNLIIDWWSCAATQLRFFFLDFNSNFRNHSLLTEEQLGSKQPIFVFGKKTYCLLYNISFSSLSNCFYGKPMVMPLVIVYICDWRISDLVFH